MQSHPRILVVYAHPLHSHSRVNRRLIDLARAVEHVQVHDLYETYPDFHIDIEHDQALLAQADLIVFQHPLLWYSMPSLLKEWVDVVLEKGWAYGDGGVALRRKDFWLVTSAGGDATAYSDGAYHGHPFSAFLPQYRQMANLCGMRWHEPLVMFGADDASNETIDMHAESYRHRLATYPQWLSE